MTETMMTYIHEEEHVCRDILGKYEERLQVFKNMVERKQPQNWLVLATGSSMNATFSAKYYIEKIAGVSVEIVEPFTFMHYERLKDSTDLILAISQGGHSHATIEALKKFKDKGIPTAVLTSNINSPIAKYADTIIDIGCGVEKVGFVTKGFTSTVLTLMLTGIVAGKATGRLSEEDKLRELKELKMAVGSLPDVIDRTEKFYERNAQELNSIPRFAVVGYGPTFGTAKEGETKFTETVRVPTQGFELEAYMHGPYLEVDEDYGLIFIQTNSVHATRSRKLRDYFEAYTDHCFTITSVEENHDKAMSIGLNIDEWKSPLLMVIPFQILAYRIASGKGIDLGKRIFDDFDDVLQSKV